MNSRSGWYSRNAPPWRGRAPSTWRLSGAALERGMHALGSGLDIKAYAESAGRRRQRVSNEVLAARVADAVTNVGHELTNQFVALTVVHAAPRWLWLALVGRLLARLADFGETRPCVARDVERSLSHSLNVFPHHLNRKIEYVIISSRTEYIHVTFMKLNLII